MTIGHKLSIAILAAAFGGLVVPAFAQNGTAGSGDQGMTMGHMGRGDDGWRHDGRLFGDDAVDEQRRRRSTEQPMAEASAAQSAERRMSSIRCARLDQARIF